VPPIHIIVKNGHVALRGVVLNQADSQLAYMAAQGVSGVFEVKNELQIEQRVDVKVSQEVTKTEAKNGVVALFRCFLSSKKYRNRATTPFFANHGTLRA
jgi:uncharacterized membrane protein